MASFDFRMGAAGGISVLAFFLGAYGLHLRIQEAASEWKEEIACLVFNASAAGGANDGIIQATPSVHGGDLRKGKGVIGQFRASRASMADWDRGSMAGGVTLFSRPASRVMNEAEKYEIPGPSPAPSPRPGRERMETMANDAGCHAMSTPQENDVEQGVTYMSARRQSSGGL
jgi:hypothetical protein